MNMKIDWGLFSERVPKSTLIRWERITNAGYIEVLNGILLEFAPFRSTEVTSKYGCASENSVRLHCQQIDGVDSWRIPATDMEFLIDGEWLNFWQVIT
jgi:hypothetical protein